MRYTISPAVLAAYPGYVRGVVVARNCRNSEHNPAIEGLLRGAELAVRVNQSLDNLPAHPKVAAWRQAFSHFGATPSKFPSSVEAIVKRAHRGDHLPYINDLVALGTYLTLKYLLPTGGHDLAAVEGDLWLRFARGDEPFTPLGGGPVEYPEPGEVVYTDAVKVLTRRWVWRQCEQDKLTLATHNLEINVDGLPPATEAEVRAAMEECAALLHQYLGAETELFLLSARSPVAEFFY